MSPIDQNAALEEFKALRAEILLRIQLRSQLLALAFSMFGVAIALTANKTLPTESLFVFPIISTFIALEWSYHDLRIFAAASYIKREIESVLPGLRWQHHLDTTRQHRWLRVTAIAAGGIFVGASFLTLLFTFEHLSTLHQRFGCWLWAIYALDFVSIVLAIWSLAVRRVDSTNYKHGTIHT